MSTNTTNLSGELSAVKAERDRIGAELNDLNNKLAADPNNAGLKTRGENLLRGLKNLETKARAIETEWRTGVLDGIADGSLGTEAGSDCDTTALRGRNLSNVQGEALRAIDAAAQRHKGDDTPDDAWERATSLVTKGSAHEVGIAAQWASATASADYEGAFAKLVANPTHGHLEWTAPEAAAYRRVVDVKNAMSVGTDTSGGHMVPLTLDPAIILTNDGNINPLRQISRVVRTATDQWKGITSAGVTAEWKAEAAEAADASPTPGEANIPVHFGDAYVPFSFEFGMDVPDAMGQLQMVMLDGATQLVSTAYTNGTGSGQPTGVITALDGTSSEVTPTTAETFAAADVYKVQNALPPRFQGRAQWCAEISTINHLAQMETTNGALKFPGLDSGQLLRKPIRELSEMDAYGDINVAATADNHLLLYGDFSQFVIVDRIGATVELLPQLVGSNRRPTGQRGLLLWFRTGSDVVVDGAFRVLNVATTA